MASFSTLPAEIHLRIAYYISEPDLLELDRQLSLRKAEKVSQDFGERFRYECRPLRAQHTFHALSQVCKRQRSLYVASLYDITSAYHACPCWHARYYIHIMCGFGTVDESDPATREPESTHITDRLPTCSVKENAMAALITKSTEPEFNRFLEGIWRRIGYKGPSDKSALVQLVTKNGFLSDRLMSWLLLACGSLKLHYVVTLSDLLRGGIPDQEIINEWSRLDYATRLFDWLIGVYEKHCDQQTTSRHDNTEPQSGDLTKTTCCGGGVCVAESIARRLFSTVLDVRTFGIYYPLSRDRGVTESPLLSACSRLRCNTVRLLLDLGANPNWRRRQLRCDDVRLGRKSAPLPNDFSPILLILVGKTMQRFQSRFRRASDKPGCGREVSRFSDERPKAVTKRQVVQEQAITDKTVYILYLLYRAGYDFSHSTHSLATVIGSYGPPRFQGGTPIPIAVTADPPFIATPLYLLLTIEHDLTQPYYYLTVLEAFFLFGADVLDPALDATNNDLLEWIVAVGMQQVDTPSDGYLSYVRRATVRCLKIVLERATSLGRKLSGERALKAAYAASKALSKYAEETLVAGEEIRKQEERKSEVQVALGFSVQLLLHYTDIDELCLKQLKGGSGDDCGFFWEKVDTSMREGYGAEEEIRQYCDEKQGTLLERIEGWKCDQLPEIWPTVKYQPDGAVDILPVERLRGLMRE
ncbi:hypothetical protein BJ508DRAFT_377977 [Ascobolus immersus RN42]|uniref:Uncharacterized protein n=1 Tax=Ascobolus immersus RN42 TaxID=1160509 RepID=A0A3N4HYX8_ASCIM|nr:hypothetical protein BJ508DRAFT_377977 [Ascobolus immersus RN42]